MTVEEAAKILGTSKQSIRELCKLEKIGTAWKNKGSTKWQYLINATKVMEYKGTSYETK